MTEETRKIAEEIVSWLSCQDCDTLTVDVSKPLKSDGSPNVKSYVSETLLEKISQALLDYGKKVAEEAAKISEEYYEKSEFHDFFREAGITIAQKIREKLGGGK